MDRLGRWRRPLSTGLIILAGIVMLISSLTLWVRRQALDTDQWTKASSALLRDDDVRHALSVRIVDAAFEKTDAATEIEERLPAALRPLARRLTASIRGGAVNVADEILSGPAAQKAWEDINRIAHRSLLAVIDEDAGRDARGDVAIDLTPLVTQLRTRLGLDPPANPDAARVVIMKNDQIESAQTAVRLLRGATLFLWIAVVVLFTLGIWISRGRRRTIGIASWTVLAVGIALVVFSRIAGRAIVDALTDDGPTRNAANAVWFIESSLLRDSAHALIALGVLALVGMWLTGMSRPATSIRRRLAPVFRGNPLAVYGGFILVALVLLALLPNGGRRLAAVIVLLALIVAGLETLKRMTLREFPDPAPEPQSRPE